MARAPRAGRPSLLGPAHHRTRPSGAPSQPQSITPKAEKSLGRATYAVGNSARVSYLAGLRVTAVTTALYGLSGFFSAVAGIMLVGFGGQAALGMGDPYLFQSIAAVVIGGVYILGGRGGYVGTAAGAITLVTLVSVLLAMNMPDYGRSIVYGLIILGLLLAYGREEKE